MEDTVGLDDGEVVAVNREHVVWIASHIDNTETIVLSMHDVNDRERLRFLRASKGTALSVDKCRIVGEGRFDQSRNLVIPVGKSDDRGRIVDVI
jgi:hypothetical protein